MARAVLRPGLFCCPLLLHQRPTQEKGLIKSSPPAMKRELHLHRDPKLSAVLMGTPEGAATLARGLLRLSQPWPRQGSLSLPLNLSLSFDSRETLMPNPSPDTLISLGQRRRHQKLLSPLPGDSNLLQPPGAFGRPPSKPRSLARKVWLVASGHPSLLPSQAACHFLEEQASKSNAEPDRAPQTPPSLGQTHQGRPRPGLTLTCPTAPGLGRWVPSTLPRPSLPGLSLLLCISPSRF